MSTRIYLIVSSLTL